MKVSELQQSIVGALNWYGRDLEASQSQRRHDGFTTEKRDRAWYTTGSSREHVNNMMMNRDGKGNRNQR